MWWIKAMADCLFANDKWFNYKWFDNIVATVLAALATARWTLCDVLEAKVHKWQYSSSTHKAVWNISPLCQSARHSAIFKALCICTNTSTWWCLSFSDQRYSLNFNPNLFWMSWIGRRRRKWRKLKEVGIDVGSSFWITPLFRSARRDEQGEEDTKLTLINVHNYLNLGKLCVKKFSCLKCLC